LLHSKWRREDKDFFLFDRSNRCETATLRGASRERRSRISLTLNPGYGLETSLIEPNLGAILPKLGRIMERVSIPNALFSKVQQRVLALIFSEPDRTFYMSEIIRSVDSGTGAVERELTRLQNSGLVSVERIGNQKHYQANRTSPVFEELRGLVVKTLTLTDPLKRALEPYAGKIKAAFVYGSVAKGNDTARSDIDLMVIGEDFDYSDLYTALENAESALRRKVSPIFLTSGEWRRKAAGKGSFISKVCAQPKLFIFGSEKDIAI
jgi:predicted nucleotidyltransferase